MNTELKKVRNYYGYSQKTFSQLLGIPRTTLSTYELGNSPIPKQLMKRVRTLFNVQQALKHEDLKAKGIIQLLNR